ncbi:MAG: hypothetical protein JKX76_14650 [Colwellia sp.]|nr:hypothetical protein [Colwellia sp.]
MGIFESILQRSSMSFSVIDSLEQLPQWTALYRYRNNMNDKVYIHKWALLEKLNWRAVSIELSSNINQSQVRIFHALMANSESGSLIFDYDLQQQLNQIDDGESTIVILDTCKLMDSMEFVVNQIDELNKDQQERNISVIHPAELPLGTQLCLYRGEIE